MTHFLETHMNKMSYAALLAALFIAAMPTQAAELQSAARLTFGDAGTLFVADWKAARIYAIAVPAAHADTATPFNLQDIQQPIAKALKVPLDALRFEDMAVQPGSEVAYIALTVSHGKKPASAAIVSVDHAGTVRRLATNNLKNAAAITDAPPADARFWRDTPTQSLTITDMKFYQDKLYVAGLSNRSFASTLRVYDYPFAGAVRAATVEMYHPVHNQIETRAPIRAMSIMTLNGEPTLVAAYTCTPLVTMPLSAIRDGAHIVAKTIGEMGWGSAPVGLVTFKVDNTDYALLANSSRSADLLALNQIAEGATQPGLSTPIKWPSEPYLGVKAAMIPMAATMRVDNLNDKLLLAMRRDDASGRMQLYSLPKGAYLRISDFVNEYDFKEYVYPKDDPFREFHKYARGIEGYPELAR
jgi:hypothetical protein